MATGIVVQPCLLEVMRHTELWDTEHIRKHWIEHAPDIDVAEILVRYTRGNDEVDELICEWKPAASLLSSVKELTRTVMASLRGEQLGRVILTRLPAGKVIPQHADIVGQYSKFFTRFHVPLQSDDAVIFECGDEQIHMAPGNLYWFNHGLPHRITNFSDSDRINLIIDMRLT